MSSVLVHQVLLIFSDGLDEDVTTLEPEAKLLQESGKKKLINSLQPNHPNKLITIVIISVKSIT